MEITPEVLKKYGFSFDMDEGGKYWFFKGDRYAIGYQEDKGVFVHDLKRKNPNARGLANINIKNFEQLQSLYFLLTGEYFKSPSKQQPVQ